MEVALQVLSKNDCGIVILTGSLTTTFITAQQGEKTLYADSNGKGQYNKVIAFAALKVHSDCHIERSLYLICGATKALQTDARMSRSCRFE